MMNNGIAGLVLAGSLAIMTGSVALAADITTTAQSANRISVLNNRDLVVQPGDGESALQLHFAGADRIDFGMGGELMIVKENGRLVRYRPDAYQMINGKVRPVVLSYKLDGADRVTVTFVNYDKTAPVILKRGAATM